MILAISEVLAHCAGANNQWRIQQLPDGGGGGADFLQEFLHTTAGT